MEGGSREEGHVTVTGHDIISMKSSTHPPLSTREREREIERERERERERDRERGRKREGRK